MAYSAEVSRANPTAIVLLLDQSSSMADEFGGGFGPKAVEAARVVNRFLTELTLKCAKSEGILDYYEVGVIGYGRSVGNAFGPPLNNENLSPISKVGDFPLRLETVQKKEPDGAGGLVEVSFDMPLWVEPAADGMTPMRQAIGLAHSLLQPWVQAHPDSYPPTVLNVTDGEANDGDPVEAAELLKSLSTKDGAVLLFNCHVSANSDTREILYPASDDSLTDTFARQLYQMSSELPAAQIEAARSEGFKVGPKSRGFVFNAGLEDLTRFIDIGTRTSTLR